MAGIKKIWLTSVCVIDVKVFVTQHALLDEHRSLYDTQNMDQNKLSELQFTCTLPPPPSPKYQECMKK